MAIQLRAPSYPNELRACIKQSGYSFREVSRETGIPESTLYDWAAGNRAIPHKERLALARLLGYPAEALGPKPILAATTKYNQLTFWALRVLNEQILSHKSCVFVLSHIFKNKYLNTNEVEENTRGPTG